MRVDPHATSPCGQCAMHSNAPERIMYHDVIASALQLMEAHARATKLPHKLPVRPPGGLTQPDPILDSPEGACLWYIGSPALPKDCTEVLQTCNGSAFADLCVIV